MTSKREDREALIQRAKSAISEYDVAKARRVSVAPDRLAILLAEMVAVFEQAHTPADDEREALSITDAEWREFQAIPEQGYSHRHWVDARIAERVMRDRRRCGERADEGEA